MDPLKMHFLLKVGIFHCYVSLPEGVVRVNISTCFGVSYNPCETHLFERPFIGVKYVICNDRLGAYPCGFMIRGSQKTLRCLGCWVALWGCHEIQLLISLWHSGKLTAGTLKITNLFRKEKWSSKPSFIIMSHVNFQGGRILGFAFHRNGSRNNSHPLIVILWRW